MMNRQSTALTRKALFRPALLASLLGVCAIVAAGSGWATLSARFDRDTVQDGDPVTLTIESDDRSAQGQPDLAPLSKDFDVLGTSTNSQVSIVNGRRSDVERWVVQLQPRHLGTIIVPSLVLGDQKTEALQLKVAPMSPQASAAAGKHVILESEVGNDGKPIYVQQQVPYTVRLLYDDSIQGGDLSAPQTDDAIVEQLGDEKRYTTTRDGRGYNVIERHYAIAPEKSGTLHIPAATFRGHIAVPRSPANGAVDGGDDVDQMLSRMLRNTPFANDPMFRNPLAGSMRLLSDSHPIAARGREIALEARPRPSAMTGQWLPAEQVDIRDSWSEHPPQFKAGEPVTRTITIEAKGLAASQIPTLALAQPPNVRVYPEASDNKSRTDGNVIYGVSKQSMTYIPQAEGPVTIPAINLDWWNTRTDRASRATLPERNFQVDAGVAGITPATAPAGAPASATASSSAAGALTPAPIRAASSPLADWRKQLARAVDNVAEHWLGLASAGAGLLAVGFLLAVLAWRGRWPRQRGRASNRAAMDTRTGPRLRNALQALKQACVTNDPNAAAQALLEVGRATWPADPPAGLRAVANRVQTGRGEVLALEQALYAVNASPWTGAALWGAFRRGPQEVKSETRASDDGMEPLYQ